MTIKEILSMPAGSKIGGFIATVKTAKKCWKVGDTNWQSVLFMDATGEILADINIGLKYIPILRASQLQIHDAEIQAIEPVGRKLIVQKWMHVPAQNSVWQDDDAETWAAIRDIEIRSKIKCWLVTEWIGTTKRLTITDTEKGLIDSLVEYIKHG